VSGWLVSVNEGNRVLMNLVYAGVAYPAGLAADRLSRRRVLGLGLVVPVAVDIVLATATSPWQAVGGVALWGLHMTLTPGLFAKLAADTAPPGLRDTAFGLFNLASGGALLLASLIAGVLWSVFGASATFVVGGALAALATLGLGVAPSRRGASFL